MATVTGLTASRMQEIEAASIVDGEVIAGNLILTRHDGTQINAGPVLGPEGPQGPMGPTSAIPGEVKLWPGAALPDEVAYGLWTWANGGVFAVADHPIAAAHISPAWKTAHGQSDPGAGNFRVPDLRGLTPAGLDAMPVGSARVNRMARAVAITIAGKTGEELHVITLPEMPSHAHVVNSHSHGGGTGLDSPDHTHGGWTDTQGVHVHDSIPLGFDYALNTAGATFQHATGTGGTRYNVTGNRHTVADDGAHAHNVSTGGASARHAHGISAESPGTNGQGGGGSHENVQPTVFVPYIVKLDD